MKRKTLTAERGKTPVGAVTPIQRAQAGSAARAPSGGMSFLRGLISKFRMGKASIDEVNHELGKFKSLASSPTSMPKMPGMAPKKSAAAIRGTPAHGVQVPKLTPPTTPRLK